MVKSSIVRKSFRKLNPFQLHISDKWKFGKQQKSLTHNWNNITEQIVHRVQLLKEKQTDIDSNLSNSNNEHLANAKKMKIKSYPKNSLDFKSISMDLKSWFQTQFTQQIYHLTQNLRLAFSGTYYEVSMLI